MKYTELCKKVASVETIHDLKKEKLTLAEYRCLEKVVMMLKKEKTVKTFLKNVAEWCERQGCKVTQPNGYEVNYIIELM